MSHVLELARQQVQPTLYSYNEIKLATKDFHPHNKLGEGAFGVVYKVSISHFGVQMWVNWNALYFGPSSGFGILSLELTYGSHYVKQ